MTTTDPWTVPTSEPAESTDQGQPAGPQVDEQTGRYPEAPGAKPRPVFDQAAPGKEEDPHMEKQVEHPPKPAVDPGTGALAAAPALRPDDWPEHPGDIGEPTTPPPAPEPVPEHAPRPL